MNILSASFEVAPLAKSGGLADVVASLSIEWKKQGHNPIIFIPKYYFIDAVQFGFVSMPHILVVQMGYWQEYASLLKGKLPNSDVEVYLIEHNGYYGRDGIYGDPQEFFDNPRRFIFFSKAIFEAAKLLNFKPDIIHAHDFHLGYVMAFLKCYYRQDVFFQKTSGVFTIHNLAYQGRYAPELTMLYSGFGMNNFYGGSWFEYYGSTNYMKTGIMFADKITTVSPTYAAEIRNDYYGEGLQGCLDERSGDLVGILNGADYQYWNPNIDNKLPVNYNINSLNKKKQLKDVFFANNGIQNKKNIPMVAMISRLVEQKGIDLLMHILEDFLWNNKFVITLIGNGNSHYENYFNYIKSKYPNNSIVYIGYNEPLTHNVYAASDFFLIPSRFEPCGLTQMYAMKYGSLPIVRATGGLLDTVKEYIPNEKTGNGFVFWNYNAIDFASAINRALSVFYSDDFKIAQTNAMNSDFSAERAAKQYIECFNWSLEKV